MAYKEEWITWLNFVIDGTECVFLIKINLWRLKIEG
jgi:hypothetical protein